MTYAWTEVNIIDTTVTATNISPRIGMTATAGDRGDLAVFIGATYLDAEVDLAGSVTFETPDVGDGSVTIDYFIRQSNRDKWNYLIGFNWDPNRNWSINAEGGFGGSRDGVIAGVTYRF